MSSNKKGGHSDSISHRRISSAADAYTKSSNTSTNNTVEAQNLPQASSSVPTVTQQPSPSKMSMEVTLDFDASPGSVTAATVLVPDEEPMTLPESTITNLQLRHLKSPAELHAGMQPTNLDDATEKTTTTPTPTTTLPPQIKGNTHHANKNMLRKGNSSGGHERAMHAIQSMNSPAAAAAAAKNISFDNVAPSMICTVAHKGMELLFCAVVSSSDSSKQTTDVVGVCARTRVTLQYLDIPHDGSTVTSLAANPANGMVIVGLSNGTVRTFHPTATSATLSNSSPSFLKSAFGRYRWINGPSVDCRPIFSLPTDAVDTTTFTSSSASISSSADYKLLVAHGDQMAIFLVAPSNFGLETADVLWTTSVQHTITTARISGDGQAIVYLLEGEGLSNDNPFGARTFLRDGEDGGAGDSTVDRSASTESIGLVFQPGPFLVHTAAVTHLSFRGFGHATSSVTSEQDEGNDLLLTYCDGDNAVRLFSQNSWKQLIHWNTPPHTRVDWVRGVSAFNLGDLESNKGGRKGGLSSQLPSRKPSLASGTDESASTTAFQAAVGGRSFQQSVPAHPTPSTSAGAWIAEITFRSAFPALRLSRISYLKRGNDEAQPAHFESVSAILPAGSVIADGVLQMGEMGLSVQGIWPAWHPWANNTAGGHEDSKLDAGTLSGSAMQFLGLSSTNLPANGFFGDNSQGGTHSPPSELRLIASHPKTGNVVLMEFPLWGDQDFGAMELGSPLRYLLSLSEITATAADASHAVTCLDYESNKLCAQIEAGSKAVAITWRKQGSHSLLPGAGLLSTSTLANALTFAEPQDPEKSQMYCDLSVLPVPLSLPSLKLPPSVGGNGSETIVAVQWWPDENYGGPPQLLSVCSSGTLIVFEMPPPWSALEPTMPSYDPFSASTANTSLDGRGREMDSLPNNCDSDSDDSSTERREYEVMITPHSEFGIGLRLESQIDGMPAIAGSYKKHPLNGGRLPAERTGMIMLGDELLSVNGVTLEGITFDDIIITVRQVGGDAAPGAPLCMKFRPVLGNRRRASNSAFSSANSEPSQGARRSREQILGVSPKSLARKAAAAAIPKHEPLGLFHSQRTVMVGETGEMQQEFARVIAVVRDAIPGISTATDVESMILLLPWTFGVGAPSPSQLRGAALLVVAEGKTLHAKRLEVALNCNPDKAQCIDLGHFVFESDIKSIQSVRTRSEHWGLSVCHGEDRHSLVFISIKENNGVDASPPSATWVASFEHFPMVAQLSTDCLVQAYSSELFGTMEKLKKGRPEVCIWSAVPEAKGAETTDADMSAEKNHSTHRYCKSVLFLDEAAFKDDDVVDFRFVSSGFMDGLPWIVLLTKTAAVVHIRSGGKKRWSPTLIVKYPSVPNSNPRASRPSFNNITRLSPADSIPHLVYAIRSIVDSCDEANYIRSDWHPDSVLSYVCTDNEGPLFALGRNVKGIYQWLSKWTHPDTGTYPVFNDNSQLGVTPFRDLNGHALMDLYNEGDTDDMPEVSGKASIMSMLTAKPVQSEESLTALIELQNVLCPSQTMPIEAKPNQIEGTEVMVKQNEYKLPPPLRDLNRDEIRLLWAIGEILSSPPTFKSLDAPAQHTLFCASLFTQLKAAKNDEEQEECIKCDFNKENKSIRTVTPTNSSSHSSRQQSFRVVGANEEKEKPKPAIAVSGGLAALASKTQTALINKCRPVGEKFDWETARSLRLPFWVRSDDELRKLSVEIGQNVFRKTRDVMECAIFFIIAGNMRTLKNLAATDHKESGRLYMKFLCGYDFTSPRGRQAAEKNAYSLLRKNRYNVASSFFLLAKPPMLKAAIETIVSKSGDPDLAFLVTRLVEAAAEQESKSQFGGALSFGGGGGYAGGGLPVEESTTTDDQPYEEWAPKLGKGSKQLLRDRLELAEEIPCLRALLLVWLSRKEEAARELSALDTTGIMLFPQSFDTPFKVEDEIQPERDSYPFRAPVPKVPESANYRVVNKANDVIDFVSRPFLLTALKSSVRSRWAATLQICHSLTRRGIELPAARCLLQNTDQSDYDEIGHKEAIDKSEPKKNIATARSETSSSIFDSYDAPSKPKNQPQSGEMVSTIFDDFNAPPPQPKKAPAGNMASSIFDGFDAAPQKPKKEVRSQGGQMASSIFDSFDAAPQKPKKVVQSEGGLMASSIFDSFDAVPQKPKKEVGQMASSIFDSFDAAPQKPKQEVQSQGGQMASSIFDSFDAAPQKPKKELQSQGGQMASSIFDSFDAAPQRPKKEVQSQGGQMASSVFDSFDSPAANSRANPVASSVNGGPSMNTTAPTVGEKSIVAPEEEDVTVELPSLPTPRIWMEWRNGALTETVARRLLREVGRHVDRFHADLVDPPIRLFCSHSYPLIPSSAAEILRTPCDGQRLLDNVTSCLQDVCRSCGLKTDVVVDQALRILDTHSQPRRVVLVTLLHTVADRADLAEDVIRDAAIAQMQRCDAFALGFDDLVDNRKTIHHTASQHLRRLAVRVSWQLELCLWLHRGGVIPLSGTVLKEAIVAARIGFVIASWGKNHDCLDTIIRNDPDCPLDPNGGRQLWSSMKMIAGLENKAKKVGAQGSGGWEFLVDCRREEATTMLRKRLPGSFIIRPHAEDNGVFTLSFKTNLTPVIEKIDTPAEEAVIVTDDSTTDDSAKAPVAKPIKKDDVVQHAIIRLSDVGFRCGSFGPFASLLKLLEAVSASLPFDLLFDKPPTEGVIKEDHQPSPNAVFLRKFALSTLSDHATWDGISGSKHGAMPVREESSVDASAADMEDEEYAQLRRFGVFSQLLALSEIRKQLSSIASANYEELIEADSTWNDGSNMDANSEESLSDDGPNILGVEERYAIASRLVRPLLTWCHSLEIQTIHLIAPELNEVSQESQEQPCALAFTESAIELAPHQDSSVLDGGDAMIRRMIQPESGVEFRTLRVGEGGESAMIVLFSKSEAISWVKASGMEKTDNDALNRLARMETRRVIEPIALSDLNLKAFSSHSSNDDSEEEVTCYRFVDPWEVEALESREGETKAAALGRDHYLAFSVNAVANSCESTFRKLGGLHLLGMWSNEKGGLRLTKAVASVHPPWERDAGGDLQMSQGTTIEPTAYDNAIRLHLYRNALFRRLEMPQRFLALVQVELLDLKNLNAPGGTSLSVYALLRLKRPGSSAPLTHKARTLDSAATQPKKIGKSSGPNAPASWGSLVRFRFPLPEDVNCDGISYDADREALFRGPPCMLQLSVYEKKFMSDIALGGADVKLDALTSGGQMEEWVPLRSQKRGINWFARMRLTLRFELMCMPSEVDDELPSSVGLSKIQQLSKMGGTHEDKVKKSASTPDILSYFESMVY